MNLYYEWHGKKSLAGGTYDQQCKMDDEFLKLILQRIDSPSDFEDDDVRADMDEAIEIAQTEE